MTTLNFDRTHYVVWNDYGKIGIGSTVVDDRRELIDNLVRGELGFDDVIAIQSFNPVEGWATDCTGDVFADVDAEKQRRKGLEDFPLSRFNKDEIMAQFDDAIESIRRA